MKNPLNNVSYFMAIIESNALVKVNISKIKSNFLVKVNFEEELMVKECLYYY